MHRFPLASVSALVFAVCLAAGPVQAQPGTTIMPVGELREGMRGIGRTVILGTQIQDFNVEIIGILERGGFNGGPMVLVRGDGPVLDATGGFAGGYSGSPVYIDGKMIGAISAAWFFADHSIAGVTP
ncbi:MAG TPA: SpoIVB peptidase S55 domain-containing protein, partial [bacterium]|nr:SpoIVB peptidase S55 domain-containing protein [bacterium]